MTKIRFAQCALAANSEVDLRKQQDLGIGPLAQKTGYSAFLISKLCERLLRSGYISETGSGDSTGGRRPTLLSISPGLGRVIGIQLGTVDVRIALTDITGTLIESSKPPATHPGRRNLNASPLVWGRLGLQPESERPGRF